MKYLSVKEEIQKQKVSIDHISTSDNIADPITKWLSPKDLMKRVKEMDLDWKRDAMTKSTERSGRRGWVLSTEPRVPSE